jgi:hypothetical protein
MVGEAPGTGSVDSRDVAAGSRRRPRRRATGTGSFARGARTARGQSRNCGGRRSRMAASASGRSADSSIAAFHVAT